MDEGREALYFAILLTFVRKLQSTHQYWHYECQQACNTLLGHFLHWKVFVH